MVANKQLLELAGATLGSRRTNWSQHAALVVGVIAVASVALLWWANEQWRTSYATYLPAADSIHRARQAAARAFVLENDMQGDEPAARQEIGALLDRAALSASDAASGRSAILGITGRPPSGDLAREITAYREALDAYHSATERVLGPGRADPAAHVAHRAAYGEADLVARRINSELSIRLGREIADQQVDHRIGVVLWVAFLGAALLLLARSAGEQRVLNRNRQLLTMLIESCEEGIYVKNLAGRYVLANVACGKILRRPAKALLGRSVPELFPAELAGQAEASDRLVIESGRQTISETSLVHDDGTSAIVQIAKGPVLDADGRVVGTYGIMRDITALREEETRRQHSAMLESELGVLRDVLENSLAGYWDWNIAAQTMFLSPNLLGMLGYAPGEVAGTRDAWTALMLAEDRPRAQEGIRRHFASRGQLPYCLEVRYCHRNGSIVWVICSGRVVEWDTHDEPVRMVGCHIDVTAQHERTQELADARERAEAASRAKSEFLANMSHEIRTPLNAILGLAYVLETAGDSERTCSLGRRIHRTGGALLGILNDILDFSKIEAGRLELERRPFWLGDLLEELRQLGGAMLVGKSLCLRVEAPPVEEHPVIGDAMRLKQVLANLLGNAVKFTDNGEIALTARVIHRTPVSVAVRFAVRDTGVGIPAEQLESIFAPFVQGDASTTRRFGGTGLGLSISQRIVSLMGGRLDAASKAGQGSEFSFELLFDLATHLFAPEVAADPATTIPHRSSSEVGAHEKPERQRIDGLRVLVVDDSETNRDVAGLILEGAGARVTTADHGAQALEILRAAPADIDVVLLDIQMPVMDGYATIREIRQTPALAALPVFALTAGALHEQREAALSAGMNGFISKPFSAVDLIAGLAALPRRQDPDGQQALAQSNTRSEALPPAGQALPGLFDDNIHGRLWQSAVRYRSTLSAFLAEHRDDPRRMREALTGTADGAVKARQLAHKLAGAAGNMAFARVAWLARKVETALLRQEDAMPLVASLATAMKASEHLVMRRFGTPEAAPDGESRQRDQRSTAAVDAATLVSALRYALGRGDRSALLALLAGEGLPAALAATLRAHVEAGDFTGAAALLDEGESAEAAGVFW